MKPYRGHVIQPARYEQHRFTRELRHPTKRIEAVRPVHRLRHQSRTTGAHDRPGPAIQALRHLLSAATCLRGRLNKSAHIRASQRGNTIDLTEFGAGDQGCEAAHAMPD